MNTSVKRLLVLLVVLAIIVTAYFSGLDSYLKLENFKENRSLLERFVVENYWLSVTMYILAFIITAVALPGALVLTMVGGVLFHTFPGALYATVGATVGGVMGFLLARYMIGEWLQGRYREKLAQFNSEIGHNGFWYLMTARLVPIIPFLGVSYLCGLTSLSFWTFVGATAAGVFPACVAYAFIGNQVGNISFGKNLVSPQLYIAFLLAAFLSLLPVVRNKIKDRKRSRLDAEGRESL
jgi:uncharacterized membrane protein YdjX (TVP38/TMEM64 family)